MLVVEIHEVAGIISISFPVSDSVSSVPFSTERVLAHRYVHKYILKDIKTYLSSNNFWKSNPVFLILQMGGKDS